MATAMSTVITDEKTNRVTTRANSKERDEDAIKQAQKSLKKKIKERKGKKNKERMEGEEGDTSDSSINSKHSRSSNNPIKPKKVGNTSKRNSDQEETEATKKPEGKSREEEKEKTNKEVAEEILSDPKLSQMKQQLIDLCDIPDLGKMRTVIVDRAMSAVQLLTFLQRRTSRIPAEVNKEMDGAIKVIIESIQELESRVQHAEAKVQLYDEMRLKGQFQTNTTEVRREQQATREESTTTSHSYAQAVQNATSTLIIQSVNRNTAEVRKQLNRRTKEYEDKIEKVQPIRNGIKIQMKTAEEAERLKKHISQDQEAQSTIRIQHAGIKKKRIIIFNVPEQVEDEDVQKKLWSILQLHRIQDLREDVIQPLRAIRTRNEVRHIPLTMPETLANQLLKMKTVTFGFQDCRIQQYVTIQRCYKCLQYDHFARECKENNDHCSLCGGTHNFKDCKSRRRSCKLCMQHNEALRRDGKAPLPIDHAVNSPNCTVYRNLLQIRQIEAEQGRTRFTKGAEVVKRLVWVAWVRGKPNIERRLQSRSNAT